MPGLPQLLLVEDDHGIGEALSAALKASFVVSLVTTGQRALALTLDSDFDLIIIDLGLPDTGGEQVCRQLLNRGLSAPILILTAQSNVLTKIKLLDMGASDYLTKPFSLGELKARLRALLRVSQNRAADSARLVVGDLLLDKGAFKVSRAGREIKLRRKEFDLLECLMANAGLAVSRQKLIRYGWPSSDELWTNSVEVHIKSLRDKIDRPFGWPLIKTVHGFGYRLVPAPAQINEADYELAGR